MEKNSVAGPDYFDTDPTFHFDMDPDKTFTLIRIRIRLFDTDPDQRGNVPETVPTFYIS
jgi:hypothetical protein